jgi:hypothetical protein
MNQPSELEAAATNATDRARQAILAELLPLQEQATALRERLSLVESEQAPLAAALTVLEEQRKGQGKESAKGRKPCAKKADVEAVCYALIFDNRSLPQDDLEGLAKAKLSREQGFNLSGFGLRFKECLASAAFSVSASGIVTLAPTTPSTTSRSVVDNPAPSAIMD